MLFNSYEFILAFLPVAFFVYFWLNGTKLVIAGKAWLVLCSLFFYSWWNVAYLSLILTSMLVNYAIGTSLGKGESAGREVLASMAGNSIAAKRVVSRKVVLTVGIVFNLGLLGYFKYADFFVANLNELGADFSLPNVMLPLAISFFTFQQIAYLVDSYREETREYDFLNYALFVTFFPQLIAGPIVHHKEMMPQFASRWNLVKRYRNIALGLFIFSMGLFKKVVIADTFAQWATPGFDVAPTLNFFEAWATSLSYTFQLYFDFSGYTDMAIGAALLFNIKLPINFNSPYKALDIQDFWRRWHITLSRFLRDYLYIPLGGNRKGAERTYVNLFATFLLGGLWHGASCMFVIWGALHGLALVVHRLWQLIGFALPKVVAWVITFNFVNFSWVFFRADKMDDALKVIKGMLGMEGLILPEPLSERLAFLRGYGVEFGVWIDKDLFNSQMVVYIALALLVCLLLKNTNSIEVNKKMLLVSVLAFVISFTMLGGESEFLYFNF